MSILIAGAAAQMREIPNPAAAGSGQSYLTKGPDGRIYLSWTEPFKTGHRLQYAVREGDKWRPLGQVADGANWFVNWADYPTFLALADGSFAAHWLEMYAKSKYSYGIKLARRDKAGSVWKILFSPKAPAEEGQYYGFVSMMPWGDSMGASYLAPGKGAEEEAKSLRFARFDKEGKLLGDDLLDPEVCTCCQTSAVMTADGPLVAYRDHEPGEIRDIALVSFRGGKWSAPRSLHRDGWKINACPVNGPSLVAEGKRVAAAWYTGANDSPRVYAAVSKDSGATFTQAARLDEGKGMGRVATILLADGTAVASWLERTPSGGAEIRIRRMDESGKLGPARVVASTDAGRKTGFPKMVAAGENLLLTWTGDRIRTVEVAIPPMNGK